MNVIKLVKKYGGQSVLASQLGIGQSAVAYWVKKNTIPSKWHLKLLELAQQNGIDIVATDLLVLNLSENRGKAAEGLSLGLDINDATTKTENAPISPIASDGARQFLFYASENGAVKVQVMLGEDTVWASQKGMAEIFDIDVRTVSEHLKKIFKSNELEVSTTIRKFRIVVDSGKENDVQFYNLDGIISVGYRVNSYKATQFRRWATTVLKAYLIKGFAMDDERLKQGNQLFGKDYFDELLERIREIRASERRFYQRVTDIYRECSIDYDPASPITQQFYAHVQDKLHYAIHGNTSAELVMRRADAGKPFMGLTSYKNEGKGGKITKHDVTLGKNYLNQEESDELNRLVSMYLDWAENFARRHVPMTMKDWAERLDSFLSFNAYEVLNGYGKVRRDAAEKSAFAEFEKFRIIQDREYKSDFDKIVDDIKINKRLPKRDA